MRSQTWILALLTTAAAGSGCLANDDAPNDCPADVDTDPRDAAATCPPVDALLVLVDEYYAAFNRHDAQAVGDFYAEDATLEDPEYAVPLVGRAAIVGHLQALFDGVPDVRDEVRGVVAQPDKVAVEFVATGTSGGGPFSLALANIFEFRGGKIVRDATYYDRP